MKCTFTTRLLLGLLLTLGIPAWAESPPTTSASMRERMQSHMARRLDDLKTQLKLEAAQEPAWSAFSQAMQPKPSSSLPGRGELEKLSTPERLDRMRELRLQQHAEMDRRADATKALYATLSDGQKKIFDRNTGMMYRDRGGPGASRSQP